MPAIRYRSTLAKRTSLTWICSIVNSGASSKETRYLNHTPPRYLRWNTFAVGNSEVANEPASTIIHACPGYCLDILAKVLPRGSSLHELPIFPQLRARGQ